MGGIGDRREDVDRLAMRRARISSRASAGAARSTAGPARRRAPAPLPRRRRPDALPLERAIIFDRGRRIVGPGQVGAAQPVARGDPARPVGDPVALEQGDLDQSLAQQRARRLGLPREQRVDRARRAARLPASASTSASNCRVAGSSAPRSRGHGPAGADCERTASGPSRYSTCCQSRFSSPRPSDSIATGPARRLVEAQHQGRDARRPAIAPIVALERVDAAERLFGSLLGRASAAIRADIAVQLAGPLLRNQQIVGERPGMGVERPRHAARARNMRSRSGGG